MLLENLKLWYRAQKYKNKNDKGGIKYVLQSVQAGQTVLDIGAHKAGYLYFLRKQVGEQGKVVAFEPQKTLFDYLKSLKNGLNWQNTSIEHLALSNTAGTVELFIPIEKTGNTSPGASIVQPDAAKNVRSEHVAMDTLDAYCAKHNLAPNFLKIDVEGNELAVFEGGKQILQQHKPKIIVECEARHIGEAQVLATIKYLTDLGYNGFFICDEAFLPLSEFSFTKHQTPEQHPYCNNFIFE
jgi:FkbM family methyltransferase